MTDDFDPYYTWLGIPPEEQPATHYRLLGIRPFESNLDVICNAGDQRMAFVRTFQVGKRSALSQRLLNEIAAAKVCLLDPDRRKDYDGTLRAAHPMPAPAPQVVSTYSSPASVLVPSRQAPVVRPLPVAARFPAAPANPLPAADPFADAAREVQTLALQPAARASANGKNSLDHSAVSAHSVLDILQQVSPLAAVAYGLLAVGVAMFLGVGLWISFGGNGRQPVVAGDSTVRSAAKEPATRPQPKPPVASKVAVSSPPSTAGQSTPPAARVAVKPAEPAPLPTAPIHSVPPPATTVPEPAPAGGMSPTLALARLREIGVQNLPPNPDDLRYIGLHNSNYTDADAPCLAAFPKLEVVNFGAVPVTRKTMDHLGSCRALKHLHIPKADLRDEDLACLAKLTDLRSLNAQETQLTAKVLAHIKGPSRLESLYLPQGVGREIIPYLANLPNLRNFQPMPREITDDDMKVLGQLQHLNMLDLQGAVLSAEGYKHLANLHELNYAHLSSRAPPGVMVHLKDAQLVFLNFPDSSTEGEVALFAGMKTVRFLRPPKDLSDAGLKVVAQYSALEDLNLVEASRITDQGLAALAEMKTLKRIHLYPALGDEGLKTLTRIGSLEYIHIDGNSRVTVQGLAALAALPKLERLGLPAALDDQGLDALKGCRSLKAIYCQRSAVTAEGLKGLRSLPQLEELNLVQVKLTAKEYEVIKSLTGLKTLMLQQCGVPAEEQAALKAAFPQARLGIYQ